MGFNSLPPLPIISTIFGFLKRLDLRTVGMELSDVPPKFGWDLVLTKPDVEPTGPKGVLDPSTGQTMSDGVLEVDTAESGPELGSESGEARTGPAPVFLDRLDDPFINLDQMEDLKETNSDGSDSTIEVLQPQPFHKTRPDEWGPRRRFKTTTSKPVSSLVRRPRTHSHGSPSVSSQPKEVTKPPTKKSYAKSTKKSTQSPSEKT